MWRFIGVLSLLLLPCIIDAGDPGPIIPCRENNVCVIFIDRTCKRGGKPEKYKPTGIIWDDKTECFPADNRDLWARLEIEVHDPQTWTIVVTVQGEGALNKNKFVFESSELTFTGPSNAPIAELKRKGESESIKIATQVLKQEYKDPGGFPGFHKDIGLWRYKVILEAQGEQKLLNLIGDTVSNEYQKATLELRKSGEYGKVDTGEGFAELLKEKLAVAATATTTQASDPENPNPAEPSNPTGPGGPGTEVTENPGGEAAAAQAKSSMGLVIGGVVGGLLLLVGVSIVIFIVLRQRKRNREINTERPSDLPSRTGIDETTFSKKYTTTRDTTYENLSSRKEAVSMDAPSFTGADVPSTNVTKDRPSAAGKSRKPGASKNVLSDVPSTTVTTGIEKN